MRSGAYAASRRIRNLARTREERHGYSSRRFAADTPGTQPVFHGYVIAGVGRIQTQGEPVREIRPGDVVWISPGEKHWHGGSPTNGMVHIAMQESLDGNYATWMEQVTDAEYSAKVG